MGIFDEIKTVTGLVNTEQHAGLLAAVMEYVNSPQVGGISGLQKTFEDKGLGHIVGSWIGSGQNLPISTDQLQGVLHSEALTQAAQKFGVDPNQLSSMMSQLLPHVVDKMTPGDQTAAASAAS
jgi:uncharacterized protein YidB (DUF937 family)